MTSLLANRTSSAVARNQIFPGIVDESQDQYLTIGQMASQFGLSLRALRFYEDRGLLSPLRQGTMRLYDRRQKMRLEMILKGKRLGFTLTEIRGMVGTAAREEPAEIEAALEPDQISSQIGALEEQRQALDAAISELRSTQQRIGNGRHVDARAVAG